MLGFGALSESGISELPGGLVAATGTAAGVATVAGAGTALKFSTGTAIGLGTVAGLGRTARVGTGSAAGQATVLGSTSREVGIGTAAGAATVGGEGEAGTFGRGAAAGVAIVSGKGATVPLKFDWLRTVISQYANSPILLQLIYNFDQCVDQSANMQAFYDLIWNVDTAQGYGLDVWGRIVGVNRVLKVEIGDYFGMTGPGGASGEPYNQAPFYAGAQLTENYALTDQAFRTLIFAKALSNISDGSVKSINQILINLFGSANGNAYATDNGDMTMSYTFEFPLTAVQEAIVGQSGVLPKPTGVHTTIIQI